MSNVLASLLTDRKIGTRIGLGFACVLAVLVAVSGITWYAFRSAAATNAETTFAALGTTMRRRVDLALARIGASAARALAA